MAAPDLRNRTPTVTRYRSRWLSWPSAPKKAPLGRSTEANAKPAPASTSRDAPRPTPPPATAPRAIPTLPQFLAREAVTLVGLASAALTLLSFVWFVPFSPFVLSLVAKWMIWSNEMLAHLVRAFGVGHVPALDGAILLALSFVLIALGAVFAGDRADIRTDKSGRSLLGNATILSFLIFIAALIIVHLGAAPIPGGWHEHQEKPLIAVVAGYLIADLIGRRGFHKRLSWLAVALALLLWINWINAPGP